MREDEILRNDPKLLRLLLADKTTGGNILWATKDYAQMGDGYEEFSPILPALITGDNKFLIRPRISKEKSEKASRTREKAEVFTPAWVCNKQNNLVDEAWFGRPGVFNTETDKGWVANTELIVFDNPRKPWNKYVDAQRLEITCGEAPYLVSRYDTVSGDKLPIERRIGLLDRKLRVVNENTYTEADWCKWAQRAFESVYGYEYQGDNLLLARENLLFTYIDYYIARFGRAPSNKLTHKIALIISWNIWQMDGLKYVVPNSCFEEDLFDGQIKMDFDDGIASVPEQTVMKAKCPGCSSGNIYKHNGIYCRIQDWRDKSSKRFVDMIRKEKGNANK
ncbi:MAG: restriction endonuclease subunit M [Ruminococcus sp.]|nr:restriction endonuclease subunit M [Ruminococcus sp.]